MKKFLLAVSAIVTIFFIALKAQQNNASKLIVPAGTTVETRFPAVLGYTRLRTDGFGSFLKAMPLQPHGSSVHLYDGRVKPNNGVYAAVIKMDIGTENLQQCADAVMRLRAEYLFHSKQYDKIHFNFTSGFKASYISWRAGNRIAVSGNKVSWTHSAKADTSYACFKQYLRMVFNYAGTLSLSKEMKAVAFADMKPGDVLIYGGNPGHCVIVMDMIQNAQGKKRYMIAQSYMPAQEIQILQNGNTPAISPWYELNTEQTVINTPEWDFTTSDLKRFADD